MSTGAPFAGSDTRSAWDSATVRAGARAATLVVAPGLTAAFMAPAAWRTYLTPGHPTGWLVPLCIALGIGGAILAWQRSKDSDEPRPPAILGPMGVAALLAFAAGIAGDARLIAMSLPAVAGLAGLAVGDVASLAARARPAARSAVAGIISVGAIVGAMPAGHLAIVGAGAGPDRAALWAAFYLGLATITIARAHSALPRDVARLTVLGDVAPPTAANHALGLHAITVRFGPNLVLDRATMCVAPGELVALIGGNGSGKSTLLRAAASFVPIETGRVTIAGEDVTTLLPEERVIAGLSFVSGAKPVFPELTVLENLRVASYPTHKTHTAFRTATDMLLELVPTLADRRGARAGVLSGGEQRLLAVVQTLYRRPVVLLADELTLGLDIEARHAVMDLLRSLANEGVAVVCVDHDLPSLLPRCDRAALLTHGMIEDHDDPTRLLAARADLLPATFLAGVNR